MFDTIKKQEHTDKIIEYLSRRDSPAKISQFTRLLKIDTESNEYAELKELLQELIDSDILEKFPKKKYHLVSRIKSYNFQGILYIDKIKSYVIANDNSATIINIRNKFLSNGLNGDLVEVEIIPDRKTKLFGKVVDVIERNKNKIRGKVEFDGREYYFLPDSDNYFFDFIIPEDKLNGAKENDYCKARILEWSDPNRNPSVEIIDIIHNTQNFSSKFNDIVEEYELNPSFPDEVEKESELIDKPKSQKSYPGRLDLREELVITIDPDDAKDFDDALSLTKDEEGNRVLGVHIADVSHYVKENTELDIEARNRGNSTYLADRVIPMLPERLSNDICSLKPRTIRFAYSVIMTFSKKGHVIDYQICETVIKSKRRYAYEEVLEIINTKQGENVELILELNELAHTLREKRFKYGGINFESSEVRFKFDENKNPIEVKLKQATESTQLVEEFMLAANQVVALEFKKFTKEYRTDGDIPTIYRIHEEPEPAKIKESIEFISSLGKKFPTNKITSSLINDIINHYHGKVEANLVNQVLIRSLPKAIYDPVNYGHFGLGFEDYTHFTSPIRRYCDLLIHRFLKEYAKGRPDNERLKYLKIFTSAISKHISQTERSSMEAERASTKLTHTIVMADKVGQEFDATITGLIEFGVFVMVDDYYAEGLLKIKAVDDDYYNYEEKNFRFVGRSTKKQLKVGTRIRVKLVRVNIEKRFMDFTFVNPDKENQRRR
jgi:ribonuclease R